MIGRQAQVALAVLDDRDREALGEMRRAPATAARSRPASAVTISGFFAAASMPRRLFDRGLVGRRAATAATRRAGLS